ncbi:hypothetical protein ACFWCB_05635 [Streptomyces sp. NPDC060048]|uniref:ATP dependent DNA ligase n=1 Tax=Streptomyces sp. NPDC060048 TaxID=3347045 RepID=UPI0036BB0549
MLLVLGRHDSTGRLRTVGRTTALRPEQARQVAEHLAPAGPGHPWEDVRFAASWGAREALDTTLVRPELVAEISADRAVDRGGVWRHPLRFKRLRLDMGAQHVAGFGCGGRLIQPGAASVWRAPSSAARAAPHSDPPSDRRPCGRVEGGVGPDAARSR